MPWNNVSPMEQKQRFVSLAESGHFTMTELCREFRYHAQDGPQVGGAACGGRHEGLGGTQSCTEVRHLPDVREVERLICSEKRLHSTWGPKKIRQVSDDQTRGGNASRRQHGGRGAQAAWPGAERRRRGAVFKVERGTLTAPERPNHVLGVDFKGWFSRATASAAIRSR